MEKLESPKAANAQINGQNTAYTTPPNGGLQAWLQVTGERSTHTVPSKPTMNSACLRTNPAQTSPGLVPSKLFFSS
ncbi:hypothetical protein ABZX51_005932 [Aspergillus tubingensis]